MAENILETFLHFLSYYARLFLISVSHYLYVFFSEHEFSLYFLPFLTFNLVFFFWIKSYLDKNEPTKAINAMNIVLASNKIDSKIKHRILNEFLIFVNANPQYTPDLEKAIGYFDNDKEVNVAKEIAKFYHKKKQWDKAIKYYEQSLKNSGTEDMETNLLLLQAYTEMKQFQKLDQRATAMIEIFPAQPQFYYYSGLANNQLQQFKKAKDMLEMGLDYLVEDTYLEINFNIQLGEAYNGLGDFKKKELYFSKANQLLKKQE